MNDEVCKVDLFGPDFEERLAKVGKEDPAGLSDDALMDKIAELEGGVEGVLVALRLNPKEDTPEGRLETADEGRAHLLILGACVDELEKRFKQAKQAGATA